MSVGRVYAGKILNKLLRNEDFEVPAPYISLHTADPGETGAAEASGGRYARQVAAFARGREGASLSDDRVTFRGLPAGTYTHFGVWDAEARGGFISGGRLTVPITVGDGDAIEFQPGQLVGRLE